MTAPLFIRTLRHLWITTAGASQVLLGSTDPPGVGYSAPILVEKLRYCCAEADKAAETEAGTLLIYIADANFAPPLALMVKRLPIHANDPAVSGAGLSGEVDLDLVVPQSWYLGVAIDVAKTVGGAKLDFDVLAEGGELG